MGVMSDVYGSAQTDFGGIDLGGRGPSDENWDEGVLWAHDDCILIKTKSMNGSWVGMRVQYSQDTPPGPDMDAWDSITECGFNADVAPWLQAGGDGSLPPPPLKELGIPAGPKHVRVCRKVNEERAAHLKGPVGRTPDTAWLPEQFLVQIWDATVADTGPGRIIK